MPDNLVGFTRFSNAVVDRLGSGVFRFVPTDQAYFATPDLANTPQLATKDFFATMQVSRNGAVGSVFQHWLAWASGGTNYVRVYQHATNGVFFNCQLGSSLWNINVANSGNVLDSRLFAFAIWRLNGEVGVGLVRNEASDTAPFGLVKSTTTAGASTDLTAACPRLFLNTLHGTHGAAANNGEAVWSGLHLALGDDLPSLSDAEIVSCVLDPMRVLSIEGADEFYSFGDVCNSSGERISTRAAANLPTGARLVCPLSGDYMQLERWGAETTTPVYFHDYAPFGGTSSAAIGIEGETDKADGPQVVQFGSNYAMAGILRNVAGRASAVLAIYGPEGGLIRPVVPVPFRAQFADASNSYAATLANEYHPPALPTNWGDTHSGTSIAAYGGKLWMTIADHSNNANANSPETGDIMTTPHHWCEIDDSGAVLSFTNHRPTLPLNGASNLTTSYVSHQNTYGVTGIVRGSDGDDYLLTCKRQKTTADGQWVAHSLNLRTYAMDRQLLCGVGGGNLQSGLTRICCPLSDGHFLFAASPRLTGFDGTPGLWAIIGSVGEDFDNGAAWFAPVTGAALGANLGATETSDPDHFIDGINDAELRDTFDSSVLDNVALMSWTRLAAGGKVYIVLLLSVTEDGVDGNNVEATDARIQVLEWSPAAHTLTRVVDVSVWAQVQSAIDDPSTNTSPRALVGNLQLTAVGRTAVMTIGSNQTAEPTILISSGLNQSVMAWRIDDILTADSITQASELLVMRPADIVTVDGGAGALIVGGRRMMAGYGIAATSSKNNRGYFETFTLPAELVGTASGLQRVMRRPLRRLLRRSL
jgi:hypothetical protein